MRGLRIESVDPVSKMTYAKIEVNIKAHEDGVGSFITLCTELKAKFSFTYVRIMGDTTENVGTKRVEIT